MVSVKIEIIIIKKNVGIEKAFRELFLYNK